MLGEGERTIGARWNNGKVQEFDSYKFVSKSYHSMKFYIKSIDPWLLGFCRSYCEKHPWRYNTAIRLRKSIFSIEQSGGKKKLKKSRSKSSLTTTTTTTTNGESTGRKKKSKRKKRKKSKSKRGSILSLNQITRYVVFFCRSKVLKKFALTNLNVI